MSKQITYKTPREKSRTYPAHNCIFATQGYNTEDVSVFIDGELSAVLKLFTALFSSLTVKSKDAAYYTLEACMKVLSESVGISPDDILEAAMELEEPVNEPKTE